MGMWTLDNIDREAISPGREKAPATASQMMICVRPTAPTPIIFPASSCFAVTEESRTSRMRELFSSMMERMTANPYTSTFT